jgi:hypothetical protein
MPYAIIDLASGNMVSLVSETKYPFSGIEEEWLEPGDDNLPLPAGWPENFYPVFLFDQEAEIIVASLARGKAVSINERGWVNIGEGQEKFQLKQFQVELVFLGAAFDHLSFTGGEISRNEYMERRRQRGRQIDQIIAEQ